MDPYLLLAENKDLLKTIYGFAISIICLIIVLKSDKLFRLSFHQGIRYFRNAFFFYGIAFFTRSLVGLSFFLRYSDSDYFFLLNFIFEFFMVLASFFLLYSLVWKKFESPFDRYFSSLLHTKFTVFYGMTAITVLLDSLWRTHYFLFFSQVVVFSFASAISILKYIQSKKKPTFLKFYSLAMIMYFIAWLFSFVAFLFFNWNQELLINAQLINVVIFLLFLFGVIWQTKK